MSTRSRAKSSRIGSWITTGGLESTRLLPPSSCETTSITDSSPGLRDAPSTPEKYQWVNKQPPTLVILSGHVMYLQVFLLKSPGLLPLCSLSHHQNQNLQNNPFSMTQMWSLAVVSLPAWPFYRLLPHRTCITATVFTFLNPKSRNRLQTVQNSAARLRQDNVTSVSGCIHWLPVCFRVDFDICLVLKAFLTIHTGTYFEIG